MPVVGVETNHAKIVGFLRGGVQGEGVTGGTLMIPAGKIGKP